jgi:mono/diheme cytochrome c family protein
MLYSRLFCSGGENLLLNLSKLVLVTLAAALIATACNKESAVVTNRNGAPTAPASAPASTAATPDEFAVARETFAKRCEVCHGDKGQGGIAEIEGKKIKGPSFRSGHTLKHSDADFVKQIVKGGDGMPAFGDKLSAKEIDDLVRFIRHDFQGKSGQRSVSAP